MNGEQEEITSRRNSFSKMDRVRFDSEQNITIELVGFGEIRIHFYASQWEGTRKERDSMGAPI